MSLTLLHRTAALMISLCVPASAHAAYGPPEGTRYSPVSVDTEFDGIDQARIDRLDPLLRERAREALEEQSIEVIEDADTTLVVHVQSLEDGPPEAHADKAVSDYGTHIEVLIDGEAAGEEITLCTQKGEAELLDCALLGLPAVLERLPYEDAAPADTPPPEVVQPKPARTQSSPLDTLGPEGIVGITVAAAGLALGTVGVVYVSRGIERNEQPGFVEETNYERPGIVYLVTGTVGLAAGAGLIALGILRGQKKRHAHERARLNVAPTLGGLSLSGRF